MPAKSSELYRRGKCRICKEKTKHLHPVEMTTREILRHRETEKRDCTHYEDCLTQAAMADAVCVPCVVCKETFVH